MRYLAIDLGDKRTGLAVGDDETSLCAPVGLIEIPINRPDDLIDAITAAADEHAGAELVLGLPLSMDGTEGPRAALTRAFGDRLADRSGLTLHYFDERLTSAAADDVFAQRARAGARLTRAQRKAQRDAQAAAALLRSFLDAQN